MEQLGHGEVCREGYVVGVRVDGATGRIQETGRDAGSQQRFLLGGGMEQGGVLKLDRERGDDRVAAPVRAAGRDQDVGRGPRANSGAAATVTAVAVPDLANCLVDEPHADLVAAIA